MLTRHRKQSLALYVCLFAIAFLPAHASERQDPLSSWPQLTRQTRPWAYWWWHGSAVDKTNLSHELQRYHDAGIGGVHIIPIYGVKGDEDRFIDYLSPKWMEMLSYTVTEANRLDLGVDMTTGTGWCFGGPHVTDIEANASVVVKQFEIQAAGSITEKFDHKTTQALVAYSPEGKPIDLTSLIGPDGTVNWTAPGGPWKVYAVSQHPSGQKVKRAAPGGQGHMLNLIYPEAVQHYMKWFDGAFKGYRGAKPRAMYQDSYEYRSDWGPDFFARFEKLRGYRLQNELPALFGGFPLDADHAARVKSDYRETVSDTMAQDSLPIWVKWSHAHHFLVRNEAHGSPGNWLDLYGVADMPETEMFHLDRNRLISKFASSAAHVTGRNLVSAETGTWLNEHFTETLADMKYLADDMFLSGINHIFYHGTCYSPDEAPWPGWLFYASYEMNPRNSVWHDVPTLNAYIARCQALLQAGKPDNDILIYWPIYDFWNNPEGMLPQLTVHAREWFEKQPIGTAAEQLWNLGYSFDYVSDRQLLNARLSGGKVQIGDGDYRLVLVPKCDHIPVATFEKLVALASRGATVVFEGHLPADVPGWGDLEQRQAKLKQISSRIQSSKDLNLSASRNPTSADLRGTVVGKGRILTGNLELALDTAIGLGESITSGHPGVFCIRRKLGRDVLYFIANRGNEALDDWVTLQALGNSAEILDPMTGRSGLAAVRMRSGLPNQVHLQIERGGSLFVRAIAGRTKMSAPFVQLQGKGEPSEIIGGWQVRFVEGGPVLPPAFETTKLASWTELGGEDAQRFAGTAVYTIKFDAPSSQSGSAPGSAGKTEAWILDLGKVCQSARVRLNGQDLGTLITDPFRVEVHDLKPTGNTLEVEVTNVSANRIRDLDRRHVNWKNFYYEINVVNLNYRPFDAANWPLTDSGLIGPVTLTRATTQAQ